MPLFIFFFAIFQLGDCHSWVHCVDYRGSGNSLNYFDGSKCKGVPRNWFKSYGSGFYNAVPRHNQFGVDRGYNLHNNGAIYDGRTGRHTCQGDATLGLDRNYDGANNVVHYEVGKSYRLAWPAKNHVAATCDNRWNPDFGLRLYAYRQNQNNLKNPNQAEFNRGQLSASFSDDPHVPGRIDFKGFQNCPKFCD